MDANSDLLTSTANALKNFVKVGVVHMTRLFILALRAGGKVAEKPTGSEDSSESKRVALRGAHRPHQRRSPQRVSMRKRHVMRD